MVACRLNPDIDRNTSIQVSQFGCLACHEAEFGECTADTLDREPVDVIDRIALDTNRSTSAAGDLLLELGYCL